ncbi:hypothetical protein EPN52_02770 [bacterium]|nr:MAG: hypothetical protein EPN52_02770 [bacterium]
MIDASSSLIDVAFAASTALDKANISAVLTGGSAATFYAPAEYQSGDADFVLSFYEDGPAVAPALAPLGFTLQEGSFRHPRTAYIVEFPRGPLKIGDDDVRTHATYRRGDEVLHILTSTDTIRDRLMNYFAWSDLSCLSAAVGVYKRQRGSADLNAIEAWVARESNGPFARDYDRKFRIFLELIGRNP